ncbi:MAG TPA: DUF432 domain-containing protein [Methanomicrobia archaeon]|nr:DUF432 domain-containing protein [Methanomicrobia archaeon]
MFGQYTIPVEIAAEGVSLAIERDDKGFRYRSTCNGVTVEKEILTRTGTVLINPVEPLHLPKELAKALLIELDKTLVVEPATTKTVFLTFPIEIGVFITANETVEVLDIFSLRPQKFTLYGDPRTGVICKYWRSTVSATVPAVNPRREGVVQLRINNSTSDWVTVTRAVFNAYTMKIYYNERLVSMRATMKILLRNLAETTFTDEPLERGMTKSLELYTVRKLQVPLTKFIMEAGL